MKADSKRRKTLHGHVERRHSGRKLFGRIDTKSLRFRLVLSFVIFALLLMGSLWVLQTSFLERYYEISMEKKAQVSVKSASLIYSTREDLDFGEYCEKLGDLSYSNDIYFFIEARSGVFSISSTDDMEAGRIFAGGLALVSEARVMLQNSGSTSVSFTVSDRFRGENYLVYASIVESEYRESINLYAVVPLTPMGNTVDILASQLRMVTILSLALGAILSFGLSYRLSQPLLNIKDKAERLAEGDYSTTFDGGNSYTEIDELAGTLNYATCELAKADTLQKDLMANMSHDIRTPLTMVKSYAELIRDITGDNKEKRDENLEVIIEETDRLAKLVGDMLVLSKMQSGVESLKVEPVDIQKLAESIMATYKVLEAQDGFEFSIHTVDENVVVMGDEHRLGQVLSNLISNAVRYSRDIKTVDVEFSLEDDRVLCKVIDRGIGIDPSDMDDIWNRYQKASKQGQRAPIGSSGLGLSITKEILELHEATYGVDSVVGQGSTFWFSLKCKITN